jgi:hypothetical protein
MRSTAEHATELRSFDEQFQICAVCHLANPSENSENCFAQSIRKRLLEDAFEFRFQACALWPIEATLRVLIQPSETRPASEFVKKRLWQPERRRWIAIPDPVHNQTGGNDGDRHGFLVFVGAARRTKRVVVHSSADSLSLG